MLIGNDSLAGMPVSGERVARRSIAVPAAVADRVLRGGVRAHMGYFDWQVAVTTSSRPQSRAEGAVPRNSGLLSSDCAI